jgi:hypothetical protein
VVDFQSGDKDQSLKLSCKVLRTNTIMYRTVPFRTSKKVQYRTVKVQYRTVPQKTLPHRT